MSVEVVQRVREILATVKPLAAERPFKGSISSEGPAAATTSYKEVGRQLPTQIPVL
jgi:hypothetical protein